MTPTQHPCIAFVSLLDTGRWGASEYLWSETARYLARAGHTTLACTHGWRDRPAPIATLAQEGVIVIERFPPRGARIRDFIGGLRKPGGADTMHAHAISKVIGHRPDLVLLSCTWPTNPDLPGWCERLRNSGIPYAVLIHTHAGHHWPAGPSADRLAGHLARATAVYFVSEDNRDLLIRQLDLPPERTAVVRNPLAVDRDTAPPWPADAVARLACVGRLEPGQKGQDILLACLHDARWRERPVALEFFGEGPARRQLTKMAAGLPQGLVTFRGHVERPASIWETHHLLVFPSRFEGLGLVVAEAQLCGRPVLITDCAARELVVDGETGFIAAAATVPALRAALDRAWSRRTGWPQMGAAARSHMLNLLPADPVGDFARAVLCARAAGER
jgi:glycosyltransferase involved in cell wall biosynthesis